jgi:hypothetical protein
MTELEEVALSMLPRFQQSLGRMRMQENHLLAHARAFVKGHMPDESFTVHDGIANELKRLILANT